jgi:dephospho-CoA kinase
MGGSVRRRRLIGLTGTNGAGKGEAAAFLVGRGYEYHSLSDAIRDALAAEGREASRDNLIRKGNELRRAGGPDALARLILAKVRGPAVIDSIRNPSEIAALREAEGFFLVALDAPAALRFERVSRRGRNESAPDLAAFLRKEAEENGHDPEAQQLGACMALADATVINDGTLDDLHRQLEELL